MMLARRRRLEAAGAALAGGAHLGCERRSKDGEPTQAPAETLESPAPTPEPPVQGERPRHRPEDGDWRDVRRQFRLADDVTHLSAMLIASHPRPVRNAIQRYRDALDENPAGYLDAKAREAAGAYLGADASAIALTDSTTMGIALVMQGLPLSPGDEIVSMDEDYFVTHEAIRLAAARTGAVERRITLGGINPSADEIVRRVMDGVTDATGLVALTWAHSSTGLKIPVRAVADAIAERNAGRDERDRMLFCLGRAHGFGAQDATLAELDCDFLAAGCQKLLFGPRGTGILAARTADLAGALKEALRPIARIAVATPQSPE